MQEDNLLERAVTLLGKANAFGVLVLKWRRVSVWLAANGVKGDARSCKKRCASVIVDFSKEHSPFTTFNRPILDAGYALIMAFPLTCKGS
jgi:hypothetical protein